MKPKKAKRKWKTVKSKRKPLPPSSNSSSTSSSSSSSSEESSEDKQPHRKKKKKTSKTERLCSKLLREIMMAREKVKTQQPANNPQLPAGNTDFVNLDHHLSENVIDDIQADKYVDLAKLSKLKPVEVEEKVLHPVQNKDGSVTYKPKEKEHKIDSWIKYLRHMFIYGVLYLKAFPEKGPGVFAISAPNLQHWPYI